MSEKRYNVDMLNYILAYSQFAVVGTLGVNMELDMTKDVLESTPIKYHIPKCSTDEACKRFKENVENSILTLIINSIPDIDLDKIEFEGIIDEDRNEIILDDVLNGMATIPEKVHEIVCQLLDNSVTNNAKEAVPEAEPVDDGE